MENNKRPSQVKKAIEYIKEHGSITSREAFIKLRIMSFPKRICEMKNYGYLTKSVWESGIDDEGNKFRVKRYYFIEEPKVEVE